MRAACLSSEVNYRSDALAIVHQVESLVDVFQRHRMGDEFIDLDVAIQVLIDHAR
jgi:hypothetical protein